MLISEIKKKKFEKKKEKEQAGKDLRGVGIVGGVADTHASKGKVEIFSFMVCQQRGLTPVICVMGLGKNEGVRLHVCVGLLLYEKSIMYMFDMFPYHKIFLTNPKYCMLKK